MTEGLFLLAFALSWYGLTRASRRWPWLGIALGGLFGLLAAAGAWMIFNAPQSEGSPAGTIAVALGLAVAAVAGGLAIWFGSLGLQGVLRPAPYVSPEDELPPSITSEYTPFTAIVVIGIGAMLITVSAWWLFAGGKKPDGASTRPVGVARAHVSPQEARPQNLSAWKSRYEECADHLRLLDRPEQLLPCADDLVAYWDPSGSFEGMPPADQYAGVMGELYVAHARSTGDYLRGRSGVRTTLARVRDRFPGDAAAIQRLEGLLATMEEALRSQPPPR
jgi:hypothetical protein